MHLRPILVSLCIWALLLLGPLWGQVVIQEIHYHPYERGEPLEFVELINAGAEGVDLSGWQLEDGVSFTFPNQTVLASGDLLVVAQDPLSLALDHEKPALGPWLGKLDNDGDTVTLRDTKGAKIDSVSYGVGFPWPTASAGGGASMELIHPGLDNDLAGSWRSSLDPTPKEIEKARVFLSAADTEWRFHPGSSRPSLFASSWRTLAFDDAAWAQCQTPIGYADDDDNTVLDDMEQNYSSVYLRRKLTVAADEAVPKSLILDVYCDDGALIWINGREVARLRVEGDPGRKGLALRNHEAAWERVLIGDADQLLHAGENIIAVHAFNGTLDSSDFSFDLSLRGPEPEAVIPSPTPGKPNKSRTDSPPPQIRKVRQTPQVPKAGDSVTVSAKITDPDGVAEVSLLYQVVLPGDYIAKDDERYESSWKSLTMELKEGRYRAGIPASAQQHRHLIRYRILATDSTGAAVRVPYLDDGQPNFAYFIYDQAPAWDWDARFTEQVMNAHTQIHLIASEGQVIQSQYHGAYDKQQFHGTVVAGDRVYDHIRFRNRGETSTYLTGKNKWRLRFNRTREFAAAARDGKKRGWKRLNLNPGTNPYNPRHRGNASLNERLAFRLYELAGLPAPDTAHVLFRVIDRNSEQGADPYSGDLWGLYMAFQAVDGNLLDDERLADSDLLKMSYLGRERKRSAFPPASDELKFDAFWSSLYGNPSEGWWRRTVDLERYQSYHAISIAVAHRDQKLDHNYFLYRHPERGWHPIPWDTDMTFFPLEYEPNVHRWHPILKNCLQHQAIRIAYQNRVRGLLDLLFTHEQIYALVDELAADLRAIDGVGLADLDQLLWQEHPRTKGLHRRYYLNPIEASEHSQAIRHSGPGIEGRILYYKDFLTKSPAGEASEPGQTHRGWAYRQLANEASTTSIPATPLISEVADRPLSFRTSAFNSSERNAFASMEWRIGPNLELRGKRNHYEVQSVWESGPLTTGEPTITVPNATLEPGRTYRLRVRMIDKNGHASHWSAPATFQAPAMDDEAYRSHLVISEFMYHPARQTDGSEGVEFIELANLGDTALDLTDVQISDGVAFDFRDATIQTLTPNQRVVIVSDLAGFERRYPTQAQAVAGVWSSGKLSNKGESISLRVGKAEPFLRFRYHDKSPWPEAADGKGHSVELSGAATADNLAKPASWIASEVKGGSPGN